MAFFIAKKNKMKGKKILIGASGSIAAYKIPELVRMFTKLGAEVQVMLTPAATNFVSALAIGTLTKKKVLIDMFTDDTWSNHVMLGRWADIILIAPASCNTISKMATGACDNFLLATYMSATCPIHIAPAMDEDMWHHPSTKNNLQTLQGFGHTIIPAQHGELASGLIGMGRMAELQDMVTHVQFFFDAQNTMMGKKVMITAGPTYENLDPVRFIGNHSTGKMGIAIAEECAARGAEVQLILGPTHLRASHKNITTTFVTNAQQMLDVSLVHFKKANIAIMSAAVADYTPKELAAEKIKKKTDTFTIELQKTKDILATLGSLKKDKQYLVGFALESIDEKNYALQKLEKKNANMIILNSIRDAGAGFGYDTNKVTIFTNTKKEIPFDLMPKTQVAVKIIETILEQIK